MSRTHVLLGAVVLVLGGAFVGLKVAEQKTGTSESSAKPVPAASPAEIAAPASTASATDTESTVDEVNGDDVDAPSVVAETETETETEVETDDADAETGTDGNTDSDDAVDDQDEGDKTTTVAVKAEAKKRKRRARRTKRSRKKRASQKDEASVAAPKKAGPRTETVDGVVIASDADDPDDAVPAKTKSTSKSPTRVGKTPIAEGFD